MHAGIPLDANATHTAVPHCRASSELRSEVAEDIKQLDHLPLHLVPGCLDSLGPSGECQLPDDDRIEQNTLREPSEGLVSSLVDNSLWHTES